MNRRGMLRALGVGALAGVAGCLDSGSPAQGTYPTDDAPDDGYPPQGVGTPVTAGPVDTSEYETIERDGQQVPLVPIELAYNWYVRGEARFADARGKRSYDESHILGAVLSTAPDGLDSGDPTADWPESDRIVCYCGCPHHLSSMRAASLMDGGYEDVYVIDEGFWEWHERGYPMAGSEVGLAPPVAVIEGVASAAAGGTAWAWHDPSGQREAAPIAADGRFELHLRFHDVTTDSPIRLVTPAFELTAPLSDLTDGPVTGP